MTVSAPGKMILSGEHAVVHGYPALAGALSLRLTLKTNTTLAGRPTSVSAALKKLRATITSDIPIGSGLGSSAALAVAIAATCQEIANDTAKIAEYAWKLEHEFHATSSGIDPTTSAYGGLLWFRRESPQLVIRQPLQLKHKPQFAILHTGKPAETTGEMVTFVSEQLHQQPSKVQSLFREIESCTRALAEQLLSDTAVDLSEVLNANGKLLEELGVVSPSTTDLLAKLRQQGFACKVSGAGGRSGGSGAVLVYAPQPKQYRQLDKLGVSWQLASFSPRGVECEL